MHDGLNPLMSLLKIGFPFGHFTLEFFVKFGNVLVFLFVGQVGVGC